MQSAETGGGCSVVVQIIPTLLKSFEGGTAVQKYTLFLVVASLSVLLLVPLLLDLEPFLLVTETKAVWLQTSRYLSEHPG